MNDTDTMMALSVFSLTAWFSVSWRYNSLLSSLVIHSPEADAVMAAGVILMVVLVGGWLLVVLRNWT